jgi:VanZ family protein
MTVEPSASQPTRRLSRAGRWLVVIAWAGVIFFFSSLQGSNIPGRFSEVGHFGEYFIFGALLYLALRVDLSTGHALAVAAIAASVYGMSDEFHQHFVLTRTPDVADWGMDTIGALAGAATMLVIEAAWRRGRQGRRPSG